MSKVSVVAKNSTPKSDRKRSDVISDMFTTSYFDIKYSAPAFFQVTNDIVSQITPPSSELQVSTALSLVE